MNTTNSDNKLDEGAALKFYLKLEYGLISTVAKKLGYTTNVYMYELFKMDTIKANVWANLSKKADINRHDVISTWKKQNKSTEDQKDAMEMLKHTIEVLERENKLLHKIIEKMEKNT